MPGGATLDVLIRTKSFVAGQVVLRDIGFSVFPGQIVAVLGRSGAGKSTLLRILLGLDPNFEGHVRTPDGRAGVVFQDPRLLPWLTVADNLRLVSAANATGARIATLLELTGVPGIEGQLPSALSLGMARRVALARALMVDPALLVLDEPFASLDRRLAATLADRVAAIARRDGTIVIFATHELEDGLAIADRICVLAGQPATLAADVPVPDRTDTEAIGRVRADLLTRFGFLGAGEARDDM